MSLQPAPPPVGIIYNTSVARPDAALALGALYTGATKSLLRVGAVCVTGAGLGTAIFCDVVNRFYFPGNRSSNTALPVGLAAVQPLPPDPPFLKAATEKKKPTGDPQYVRSIQRLTDTSQAEAVLRNGVTLTPQSAVVLSAPATWLARSLDLAGVKALYQDRVKRLVIVEAGASGQDAAALKKLIVESPVPVVFCGREIGDALLFPSADIDKLFAWTPSHPVVDVYRAYKPMPYDAPLHDLAALDYAVRPDAGRFTLSEPGSLTVSTEGALAFAAGSGTVRKLVLDPSRRADVLQALVTLAATQPAPPGLRGRGGD